METPMVERVQSSLRSFMERYLSLRAPLCGVPFRGTRMPQSRYLFALSCFRMNLLREGEIALCPAEPSLEVPNGSAGHYLLGLVYRLVLFPVSPSYSHILNVGSF